MIQLHPNIFLYNTIQEGILKFKWNTLYTIYTKYILYTIYTEQNFVGFCRVDEKKIERVGWLLGRVCYIVILRHTQNG